MLLSLQGLPGVPQASRGFEYTDTQGETARACDMHLWGTLKRSPIWTSPAVMKRICGIPPQTSSLHLWKVFGTFSL